MISGPINYMYMDFNRLIARHSDEMHFENKKIADCSAAKFFKDVTQLHAT